MALPILDDKVLYLTQSNLTEYVFCGLTMTLYWFISFFALVFSGALLISRNKCLQKSNRMDVRQASLNEQKTPGKRFALFKDDLTEENPREDIVYAGLRRINQGLTLRLALDNPFGMLIVIALTSVTFAIYTITIALTMSQLTARDYSINSVDMIALRSQFNSPYVETLICIDSRFAPTFDQNIFTKRENIFYKENPGNMFNYLYSAPDNSMNECTGIVTYQSNFAFAKDPSIMNRI